MISVAAALVALSPMSQESPAALVSKMMGKYNKANSVSATINAVVQTPGGNVKVDTTLKYVRPSLFYLKQAETYKSTKNYFVISDGLRFTYPSPGQNRPDTSRYLVESLVDNQGKTMKVGDIYAAASSSIADRSTPLDLLVSRVEDLQAIRGQWATIASGGSVKFNGVAANMIKGTWKQYGEAQRDWGSYEIFITDDGDLVGFRLTEPFKIQGKDVKMVTTWTVNAQINVKIDNSTFLLKSKPSRK